MNNEPTQAEIDRINRRQEEMLEEYFLRKATNKRTPVQWLRKKVGDDVGSDSRDIRIDFSGRGDR